MQGWRKTSGSPPHKASLQGGGFSLKAGCPGSFPPPSLAELSGKERILRHPGIWGEHIPLEPELPGKASAASAPRNSGCLPSSRCSGRAGSLLHSQLDQGPLQLPGWRRRTLCWEMRVPWRTSSGVTRPVAPRRGTAWDGLGGTQLALCDSPQPSPQLPGFPLAPVPVPPTAPQPGEPGVSPSPSPDRARRLQPGRSGGSRG